MNISRRSFIKNVSFASALLVGGGIETLSATEVFERRKKVKLRFVVASDGHYGQPKTEFDAFFKEIMFETRRAGLSGFQCGQRPQRCYYAH
jgi:hypothetical protein